MTGRKLYICEVTASTWRQKIQTCEQNQWWLANLLLLEDVDIFAKSNPAEKFSQVFTITSWRPGVHWFPGCHVRVTPQVTGRHNLRNCAGPNMWHTHSSDCTVAIATSSCRSWYFVEAAAVCGCHISTMRWRQASSVGSVLANCRTQNISSNTISRYISVIISVLVFCRPY